MSENTPVQKTKASTVLIAVVIIIVGSAVVGLIIDPVTPAVTPTPQQVAPPESAALQQEPTNEEVPTYEIVKQESNGTTLTLNVFVAENDNQKTIKITDKILSENTGVKNLFVHYFDDKEIAKDYFNKMADDTISETQKDKMFSHYIANLKYNTTTNYKVLSRNQDGNWAELKKY